jgi:COMPASS component SWD1
MGGAGHKAAHNIFVWDRESGVLLKVLEGPKESLGDCEVSCVETVDVDQS